MAARRFNQFMYSLERMPVKLMASFTQSGSAGTAATLTASSITYTAKTFGTAGNSITIALVAGGTAGAEVVTVTGTAISVSIESTVSTRTQVKTAIDASTAAAALISVSVSSGGTAATVVAATPLATGTDCTLTADQAVGSNMVLTQINTGKYSLSIPDSYKSLLHANISLQATVAVDLVPQIVSADVTTAKTIVIRTLAAATPTDMITTDVLYIELTLRNSND